ncbi:hypothetical protein RRG08_032020 [Elysia crispata]|uniref:C2H2-type domain-containing protein n=3 Tax=Elysia crispata TaxID=231223 RepID=A0AAE0XVE5_9GAST|nr:hypothetical protein RRG08_032020 [Elysia crispata]
MKCPCVYLDISSSSFGMKMAEQYLNPSSGDQHSSFAEQMLSHSTNVVAIPNSYYINASQSEAIPPCAPPVDYFENSAYEPHTYQETVNLPPRNADITDISHSLPVTGSNFATLPESASQQTFENTGDAGQQFLSGEPTEGSSHGATTESMEALTRSAFELLQDVVAHASSNFDETPKSSILRNQVVSVLPFSQPSRDHLVTEQNFAINQRNLNTWAASSGTTIVVDAHNLMKTSVSAGSALSQEQATRADLGANSNKKIIKIVPQKPNTVSSSTVKISNGRHPISNYRRVLVKDPNGTQKNCFVLRPATSSVLGDTAIVRQTIQTSSSRAMKLANSVEREIMDMISTTSANFTIKGEDAKKSGILEKTSDKNAINNSANTKFFCLTCKEKYAQKEGFQFHLQRISFVLKYKCIKCATIFTFFNKCALWMHLNGHQEDIDYQRVLRLDPYDFVSNPNVFTVDMNASVASNSKEIMTKLMLNTQGIVKCPICQEFVRYLPIHLKRPDGKHHAHTCYICEINFPSKCSFLAHERLHRGCGNAICCPECGLTREEISTTASLKDVFDHVDACMHFNRAESFSCECKLSFPSLAEAQKHFLHTHIKPLSKCPSCSVAFTDSKLLASHLLRNPRCQSQVAHTCATKVTCLCTLCKSILTTEKEAKLHLQKHVPNESEPSWMCFLCSMMFASANELRIHCEEDHPHKAKRCTICFKLFCNRQLLVDHIIKKSCNIDGQHSLARCADMPPKGSIDIDGFIKDLYKVPNLTKSPISSSFCATASQGSQGKSLGNSSLRCESQQEADSVSTVPAACQIPKIAIRRPASLDNTTSALLDEIQLWMSKDGREIVPTVTPPSKRRRRPKKEKRPPHHLVCGVTAKGISYQCHPCKIIVTGTNNYISHMKYHEAKGDCSYGAFCHCSVCDKLIGSHLIMKHLKEHQDKGVIVCIRCQRKDFGDLEDAIQHAHNLCDYKKIGSDAGHVQTENLRTENVTNTVSTLSQTESRLEEDSSLKSMQIAVDIPAKKMAVPEAKKKLHPCHLCSLVFENVILRDQHVRKSHRGTRKIFCCLPCEKKNIVKTFATHLAAKKHVTSKHHVVQSSLIDKCLKEVNTSVSNCTIHSQVLLPEQQKEAEVEGPTPKKLRLANEGDFLCGNCGFSCSGDDKATFSEHIQTHNHKKEPQCPECGLCYTVLVAVKRHLLAVHKIKNIDNYLADNGILEEQEEEDEEFNSVLEEMLPGVRSLPPVTRQNQGPALKIRKVQPDDDLDSLECNVCYRSFDTEANLKTHMRTHGMAFIRSKRYKPLDN